MPHMQYSTVDDPDAELLHASERPSPGPSRHRWAVALSLLASGALVAGVLVAVRKHGLPPAAAERDVEQEVVGLSSKSPPSPINAFNDQLDSLKFEGEGLYYEFATANGEFVLSGKVEGRVGSWSDVSTPFPLASASKLYTAFAAMYTMQLKPRDWYPEKLVCEFKGWESFKNFPVHGSHKTANLTIHHLLTHTSGLVYGFRDSKEDILKQKLFYEPGTAFGYTIGHRVVGWILRDYWKEQPEARHKNIQTVDDAYRWLYWDKMGLSDDTRFDHRMTELFGYSGQAGDGAIQSTGRDLMKLAVVALRKGSLPDGTQLISEENWNKWAVPNLLPGRKLSKDLVSWRGGASTWENWNVGGVKESLMKQSGLYGWNYFGATYYDSKEIGWCGFFASCLRVSYPEDIAFVMMQRDVADLKKSKPYVVQNFATMAKSLQCTQKACRRTDSSAVFCETCETSGWYHKERNCTDVAWSHTCPSALKREKGIHADKNMDDNLRSCYVPSCRHQGTSAAQELTSSPIEAPSFEGTVFEMSQTCYATTGVSCRHSACQAPLGATCMEHICGCVAGCAGADGRCHASAQNLLVAADFTLSSAKWPSYQVYVQSFSVFGQLETTRAPSWMNSGEDKFSLFKLPGTANGSSKFLLGSVRYPGTVARMASSAGTTMELHGLYATGLNEGRVPEHIALTVCSLAHPAGAIMIGSASQSPVWAYVKHGSWRVFGYDRGDPGAGGQWLPDPPIPEGVLRPCAER